MEDENIDSYAYHNNQARNESGWVCHLKGDATAKG